MVRVLFGDGTVGSISRGGASETSPHVQGRLATHGDFSLGKAEG